MTGTSLTSSKNAGRDAQIVYGIIGVTTYGFFTYLATCFFYKTPWPALLMIGFFTSPLGVFAGLMTGNALGGATINHHHVSRNLFAIEGFVLLAFYLLFYVLAPMSGAGAAAVFLSGQFCNIVWGIVCCGVAIWLTLRVPRTGKRVPVTKGG